MMYGYFQVKDIIKQSGILKWEYYNANIWKSQDRSLEISVYKYSEIFI